MVTKRLVYAVLATWFVSAAPANAQLAQAAPRGSPVEQQYINYVVNGRISDARDLVELTSIDPAFVAGYPISAWVNRADLRRNTFRAAFMPQIAQYIWQELAQSPNSYIDEPDELPISRLCEALTEETLLNDTALQNAALGTLEIYLESGGWVSAKELLAEYEPISLVGSTPRTPWGICNANYSEMPPGFGEKIVKMLISSGADVEEPYYQALGRGSSKLGGNALSAAVEDLNEEHFSLLLEAGLDIHAPIADRNFKLEGDNLVAGNILMALPYVRGPNTVEANQIPSWLERFQKLGVYLNHANVFLLQPQTYMEYLASNDTLYLAKSVKALEDAPMRPVVKSPFNYSSLVTGIIVRDRQNSYTRQRETAFLTTSSFDETDSISRLFLQKLARTMCPHDNSATYNDFNNCLLYKVTQHFAVILDEDDNEVGLIHFKMRDWQLKNSNRTLYGIQGYIALPNDTIAYIMVQKPEGRDAPFFESKLASIALYKIDWQTLSGDELVAYNDGNQWQPAEGQEQLANTLLAAFKNEFSELMAGDLKIVSHRRAIEVAASSAINP